MTTQPLAKPAVFDVERTSSIGFKGEGQRGNRLVLWGLFIMLIGAAIGILGKKLKGRREFEAQFREQGKAVNKVTIRYCPI